VEAALEQAAGMRWSRHPAMPRGCVMCALSAEQIAGLGFEQVVHAAAVSIVVVDASGKVIHSNERARALTAKLDVEMPADLDRAIEADLDRPIDIFHPDGRRYEHHEWPAVRSLTSGEEIVEEEFFYAVPGGERLWIRCSSSLVRDPTGEIVAVVLTQTDVTERRRKEARLAYLAGVLNNTEDAIVTFDAAWLVTVWNRGAERLYGWTADETLGRQAIDVVRVELSDEQKLDARRAAAEGGRWRAEAVAYRKDGTPIPVEAITVALRGTQGEITGYLAIHRDITERQRMMDELRESQQQSEAILESITDASVAMDRDWRYVHANDRALARLAAWRGMPVTREDIIGKSVWDLFPDARGTETESRLRAAMDATEPVEFEMYFGPTDEWVEAHAHPSASGLTIYYRNITARRRAEEALREAQQLRRQAERQLDEVRAERGRVARELHDGALQGLTRALTATGSEGTNRDDDVDAILRRAREQLRAAIYDLSLEESGERTLGDSLGDLVDMTREMAPECEVTLDIDDDLAARSVGRRQAEVLRILGQALTDARGHAEAEHIVVRVTSTETRLSVEVTDDGRGAAARPAAAPGEGVGGMYERARLLGAELDIRTDDTGTTVRLQIALNPAAAVPGAAAGEHPAQSIDTELLLAARHGPGPARDRLVDAFLARIEQIARAVSTASPTPPSQLTEQGVAGLLRALDRYDPTLDTPFWGYASWWVREAMR
jgi:PAS domain S-box-containing protein